MTRPNFPTTLLEFQRQFSTEEGCYAYVLNARWPDGFKCPKCSAATAYDRLKRKQVECSGCGYCASVTAGTIMHKSKLSLSVWLWAAWLMVSSKGGISALELSRQMGISEESAFTLLHKLRHAMVDPERTKLSGRVEVDETYIGGPVEGRGSGKFKGGQVIVVGAVEVADKMPKRIRFRVVEDGNRDDLHRFIQDVVEQGSKIVTDGNPAYLGLPGYTHITEIVGRSGVERGEALVYFHTAASNLKAWLKGTHHGAVSPEHLQAYLNEFSFRYNRRGNLGAAFARLLELGPTVGTRKNDDLYGEHPPHKNPARRKALSGKLNRW